MDPSLPMPAGLGEDPSADLARLRDRIDRVRASAPTPDVLVQDLETAYEELRVADEEVRLQNESISRLVESHQSIRLQQERTMAILPVPILVTDARGVIRSANAAAATLLGTRVARLLGKPVFTLFATSDRPDLRQLLSGHDRTGLVLRRAATLQRRGETRPVEVTASDQFPGAGDGEISWILLTGEAGAEDVGESVTRSLTRLAMLPQGAAPRAEVLAAAAAIVRDGLAGRAEVSVSVGSPREPDEVASTSQTAQSCDGAQIAAGSGPSVAAYQYGSTVSSADVRTDERWPGLGRHLPPEARAVVAAAIETDEGAAGTVTAYFSGDASGAEEIVELFAVTIGGVLHELELHGELARLETDMQHALSSRAVIEQAKGIVMASRGCTADDAWQHLVDLSSTRHVKLRTVAEGIVAQASRRD
ncbi:MULTISPECIES: ANTAR domain-containing protein [unclassified Nocardioides]|uniref:ANTAR domain-containing protein n=1 Tax=unclassified Nocardioides TaxID=2615069 RepID=UPI00361D0D2C